MKNHEYVHTVNDIITSGIYRINPNQFPEMFTKKKDYCHCRNWTFRPVFASGLNQYWTGKKKNKWKIFGLK